MAEEDEAPESSGSSLWRLAEMAYLSGDAKRPMEFARQMQEVANGLGGPLNMVALAQLSFAYSHLADGRPGDAIAPAPEALLCSGAPLQAERIARELAS